MDLPSIVMPLELVDKCIGSPVSILMNGDKEFYGTLVGFDDYLTIILDDAVEFEVLPEGTNVTRIKGILINGKQICMIVPGGIKEHLELLKE